ncbi:MAG: ABC transporter permease [Acidimicrobiia bacterium]
MATGTRTPPAPEPGTTADPEAGRRRQAALARNGRTVAMVWRRELIRLRRTPTRIITGLAQPVIFLFIMGAGLGRLIQSGQADGFDYQEFLFPGILAMSVITSSLFSAVSVVWDREFGFMREMLVAPISRASIVVGKALGGGSVSVVQGLILIVAAPVVGVSLTAPRFLGLVVSLLLLAYALTAFGMVLATRMERMESFQMVMTLVMQPMIFLSGAVFPLQELPTWLAVLTRLNPATYGVDMVRRTVLPDSPGVTVGGEVVPLWAEGLLVVGLGTALLAVAVRLFHRTE